MPPFAIRLVAPPPPPQQHHPCCGRCPPPHSHPTFAPPSPTTIWGPRMPHTIRLSDLPHCTPPSNKCRNHCFGSPPRGQNQEFRHKSHIVVGRDGVSRRRASSPYSRPRATVATTVVENIGLESMQSFDRTVRRPWDPCRRLFDLLPTLESSPDQNTNHDPDSRYRNSPIVE